MTHGRQAVRGIGRRTIVGLTVLALASCSQLDGTASNESPTTPRGQALPAANAPAATARSATIPTTTPTRVGATTSAPATTKAPVAATTNAPPVPSTPTAPPVKTLVIIEENHTARSALSSMPALRTLAAGYGLATSYRAVTHPSLPNYLAIAGGSTFDIADDAGPAAHPVRGPSVFDAAIAAGATAKTYAESMPAPCAVAGTDTYAVKHNPWAYFADAGPQTNCRRYDVPAGTTTDGALKTDIMRGTLPTVGMLVPNLCNDGHDCSLVTADGWLHRWLAVIMRGPDYRAGRLSVIVTFDEDDYSGDNNVLTVIIAPGTRSMSRGRRLTHYSLSRYLCDIAHAGPLGSAVRARSMRPMFHL